MTPEASHIQVKNVRVWVSESKTYSLQSAQLQYNDSNWFFLWIKNTQQNKCSLISERMIHVRRFFLVFQKLQPL